VFRRHSGTTICAFLHAQRVLRASRAIAAGTPLAEAALSCGFCDQSHLSRVFKAVHRHDPGPLPRPRAPRPANL
jgi:AraC-like DNA-binding protein